MSNSTTVVLPSSVVSADPATQPSRRVAIRRALAVSFVAVLIGASGCSKNKNEDAVQAQDTAVETSERTPARATTERSGDAEKLQERAQATIQDRALYGYWILNTEATLAGLPEEAREPLREVFEQTETGIAFTSNGHAVMTMSDGNERADQRATYTISEKQGQLVKVEFHLDDPRFKEMGIQAFANIEHVDANTIRYQPYTVEDGVASASEHVVVMTRASADEFEKVAGDLAASEPTDDGQQHETEGNEANTHEADEV